MERVDAAVDRLDFSFLERDPFASLHLDPASLESDLVDFIYEDLVPSRMDVVDMSDADFQDLVESSYGAYIAERMQIINHLHRNKSDRYGWCRERWLEAFFAFEPIVKAMGYTVQTITSKEKYEGKYDIILKKDDETLRVRLKASEKFDRADDAIDDKWLWVEISGIYGEPGWLYGKADAIAFETPASFLIVKREDLVNVIRRVVDRFLVLDRKVNVLKRYIERGKLPMYRRENRSAEKIALLPVDLVTSIATEFHRHDDITRERV